MLVAKTMSTLLDPPLKEVVVGAEVVPAVDGTQGSGGWPGEKRGWSSGLLDCFSDCTSCCAVRAARHKQP